MTHVGGSGVRSLHIGSVIRKQERFNSGDISSSIDSHLMEEDNLSYIKHMNSKI